MLINQWSNLKYLQPQLTRYITSQMQELQTINQKRSTLIFKEPKKVGDCIV